MSTLSLLVGRLLLGIFHIVQRSFAIFLPVLRSWSDIFYHWPLRKYGHGILAIRIALFLVEVFLMHLFVMFLRTARMSICKYLGGMLHHLHRLFRSSKRNFGRIGGDAGGVSCHKEVKNIDGLRRLRWLRVPCSGWRRSGGRRVDNGYCLTSNSIDIGGVFDVGASWSLFRF